MKRSDVRAVLDVFASAAHAGHALSVPATETETAHGCRYLVARRNVVSLLHHMLKYLNSTSIGHPTVPVVRARPAYLSIYRVQYSTRRIATCTSRASGSYYCPVITPHYPRGNFWDIYPPDYPVYRVVFEDEHLGVPEGPVGYFGVRVPAVPEYSGKSGETFHPAGLLEVLGVITHMLGKITLSGHTEYLYLTVPINQ